MLLAARRRVSHRSNDMTRNRKRLRAEALDAIRTLVGALARSARSVERRTGITNAQLFVLRQLAECGNLSLNQVAERTLTRQSTVSIVVSRLAEQGLVRRARAANDRRRLDLSLTAAGRRVLAHAPEPATGRLLTALDELTDTQLTALKDGLDGLVAALGLERRAARMLFEG
jgi:DNA-binding MarR family transcriptional regulator